MEKKRSTGVTIYGWICIVGGIVMFFSSTFVSLLFFYNKVLFCKVMLILAHFYPAYEKLGMSQAKLADFFVVFIETLMPKITFSLIFFVLMPVMGYLIFRGGIGILKLQNSWRKAMIGIHAAAMTLSFIEGMYISTNLLSWVVIGAVLRNPNLPFDMPFKLQHIIGILPDALTKSLFSRVIWLNIIIYFLTRPKVKEQFK